MDGVVREVSDEEILEARALVGRYGFGCEPASGRERGRAAEAAGRAGDQPERLGRLHPDRHELKDPNATVKYHTGLDMKTVQDLAPRVEPHGKLSNRPVPVEDSLEAIVAAMGGRLVDDPGPEGGGRPVGRAGGGVLTKAARSLSWTCPTDGSRLT
jgi:threonine synthase